MGYIIFGKGCYRRGWRESPAEKQFRETWQHFNTSFALTQEFEVDVRGVSVVCSHRYIDFAHPETGLAVEIDGKEHLQRPEDDARREQELRQLGWRFRRFTNTQVGHNPNGCVATVLQEIQWATGQQQPGQWPSYPQQWSSYYPQWQYQQRPVQQRNWIGCILITVLILILLCSILYIAVQVPFSMARM